MRRQKLLNEWYIAVNIMNFGVKEISVCWTGLINTV